MGSILSNSGWSNSSRFQSLEGRRAWSLITVHHRQVLAKDVRRHATASPRATCQYPWLRALFVCSAGWKSRVIFKLYKQGDPRDLHTSQLIDSKLQDLLGLSEAGMCLVYSPAARSGLPWPSGNRRGLCRGCLLCSFVRKGRGEPQETATFFSPAITSMSKTKQPMRGNQHDLS